MAIRLGHPPDCCAFGRGEQGSIQAEQAVPVSAAKAPDYEGEKSRSLAGGSVGGEGNFRGTRAKNLL